MSLSPKKDICILVSTCDRYLPVARWTISRIKECWDQAPPVFLCGSTCAESLPLKDDPQDWMLVNLSAVQDLRARGFRWVYLILDDHPPMARCHAEHLNKTLPELAEKLDASNIGLLGYRSRDRMEGENLGPAFYNMERSFPTYAWKFSLHPALWSLERLEQFLAARVAHFPPKQRTPWIFEMHLDGQYGPIPEVFSLSTYRICGARMVGSVVKSWGYEIVLGVLGFARECVKRIFGEQTLRNFDGRFLGFQHYYRGPYPIFWSGVIHKGGPSLLFTNFLRYTGQWKMLKELKKVGREFNQGQASQPTRLER